MSSKVQSAECLATYIFQNWQGMKKLILTFNCIWLLMFYHCENVYQSFAYIDSSILQENWNERVFVKQTNTPPLQKKKTKNKETKKCVNKFLKNFTVLVIFGRY